MVINFDIFVMTVPVDESIVKQSRKRLEIDRFYRIGLKANNLSKKGPCITSLHEEERTTLLLF